MNRTFWDSLPVFITGHTGFKGSWLSLILGQLGAKISGYALPPTDERGLYVTARVADGIKSTIADVRDVKNLCRAMADAAPTVVFHLAAQPLVRVSYARPVETYDVNVMGTVNFLEAVRQTPSVRAAIVVTSDKCYENTGLSSGYRENDPMGGSDPYSSSKGCVELITSAYRRSFFNDGLVSVVTVRAGNVIGGGDWSDDRLMPDLVRAFTEGHPLKLRYPNAIRPWQHVLEPLRGYILLAEMLFSRGHDYEGGWNFGPVEHDACSVEEIVRQAATTWGEGAHWLVDASHQPHEAHCLRLDSGRAQTHLGWCPQLSVREAVAWTIEWYRTLLNEGAGAACSLAHEQIFRYEELIC